MKRLGHATGMQLIALIAIVFAAVQWGSRDVRFGVALAFVALIAFLAGRRSRTDVGDLVARIRNLAHIAEAPGMKEAMAESEVIADTVREVDSGTMYLGIEDEIHAIADALEAR